MATVATGRQFYTFGIGQPTLVVDEPDEPATEGTGGGGGAALKTVVVLTGNTTLTFPAISTEKYHVNSGSAVALNPYSLESSGPDIVDTRGYLLPTTPIETLYATLAKWMGAPDATANGVNPINLVAPNLPNFAVRDLALFA